MEGLDRGNNWVQRSVSFWIMDWTVMEILIITCGVHPSIITPAKDLQYGWRAVRGIARLVDPKSIDTALSSTFWML